MEKITEYSKFILFACGVLVGIQLPGFVGQYGKSLESHYLESNLSLAEFQDDADQYFSGDLLKLIEHYQINPDQVFNAGGESIDAIYNRNQLLESKLVEFNSSEYLAFKQVYLSPVPDIRNEVWSNYTFSVTLDKFAVAFGLLSGFLFALSLEIAYWLLRLPLKIMRKPKHKYSNT
jgi:hypothetical protein